AIHQQIRRDCQPLANLYTQHDKCRQDLLDLGVDPNLPSEITPEYLDMIFDGDPRTQRKHVHVWLQCPDQKKEAVRCTVRQYSDYVDLPVPTGMARWWHNVLIHRSEETKWEWHSRWLWPGTRVEFGDTVYRVTTFLIPIRMNHD
ncbi:unnamed protein product, partial [Symbiodinium necroappetens]